MASEDPQSIFQALPNLNISNISQDKLHIHQALRASSSIAPYYGIRVGKPSYRLSSFKTEFAPTSSNFSIAK